MDTFHSLLGATPFSKDNVFHISEAVEPWRDHVLACDDLQLRWGQPEVSLFFFG